jgi:hypothetical protein
MKAYALIRSMLLGNGWWDGPRYSLTLAVRDQRGRGDTGKPLPFVFNAQRDRSLNFTLLLNNRVCYQRSVR